MTSSVATDAIRFRSLHVVPGRPLLLANVWDPMSARLVEAAGAQAVATTSAGIAWAHGRPDGNGLTRDQAVASISRIAQAVSLPVTADIEGGYGRTADVEWMVATLIEVGVVGINIEDRGLPTEEMVAHVRAARAAADRAAVPLFINARTDVFLEGEGPEDRRIADAIERAGRYLDAGADGAFMPGAASPDTIGVLVAAIDGPVNVMAGSGALTVEELAALGVARVSLGSAMAQAAYGVVRAAAEELLGSGTYAGLAAGIDYGELNALAA